MRYAEPEPELDYDELDYDELGDEHDDGAGRTAPDFQHDDGADAGQWAPRLTRAVTLEEYRAAEAAGRIRRPISWGPGRMADAQQDFRGAEAVAAVANRADGLKSYDGEAAGLTAALAVTCPTCHAEPPAPCRLDSSNPLPAHRSRLDAGAKAAAAEVAA